MSNKKRVFDLRAYLHVIMPIGHSGKDFLSKGAQAETIEHLHQQPINSGEIHRGGNEERPCLICLSPHHFHR